MTHPANTPTQKPDRKLAARIEQCLTLSKMSPCVRRQFGAMIIDPDRNTILSDGYNGGPRKGSKLCAGTQAGYCEREGVAESDISIRRYKDRDRAEVFTGVSLYVRGDLSSDVEYAFRADEIEAAENRLKEKAKSYLRPPIPSGTQLQIGCHHAEFNAIANAAANGVSIKGAHLIVTGEPCLMCAKLLHHAGIVKVICIKGGYAGGTDGIEYLNRNKVHVVYVDGPQDPRLKTGGGCA